MKRAIFTLLLALFAVTTISAQKAVELQHTADKVVKHWNNQTAPHSNEETKDEYVNEKGYAFCTSRPSFTSTSQQLQKATSASSSFQAEVIVAWL